MATYSPSPLALPDWLPPWAGRVARSLARTCPDYRDDRAALAEDLLQEGLLRAWRAIPDAPADRDPRPFLKAHARGAMVDYLRRTDGVARTRLDGHTLGVLRVASLDAPLGGGSPGTLREARELGRSDPEPDDLADVLRSVVPDCTPREVRLCELMFRCGYSCADAARELGVDPSRGRHILEGLRVRARSGRPDLAAA